MMRSVRVYGWSCLVLLLLCAGAARGGDTIRVTEHVVFDGLTGWEHDGVTYRLACAALVAEAANGDLLTAWLSGSDKEPATDNCVLLARSSDGGRTWSRPTILVPAGELAGAVTNLDVTEDGRVVVLGANWPAEAEYTIWRYFRMESQDHGLTWSEPEPMSIYGDRASLGHRVRLRNGGYLFPGSFFEPRKRVLRAPVTDLARAADERSALALPPTDDSKLAPGKFGRFLHGCIAFAASSADGSDLTPLGRVADRPLGLLEPTAIELDDGRIVMLMRAEWGGYLWRSHSDDGGRTWSRAEQTDIPNPSSLACLVRLDDGRITLLHNPSGGVVGQRARRDPLALWISDDGMRSWSVKQDLVTGGQLAYPHAIVTRAGELVFVYDHNRRQVRFATVRLPAAQTTGAARE